MQASAIPKLVMMLEGSQGEGQKGKAEEGTNRLNMSHV